MEIAMSCQAHVDDIQLCNSLSERVLKSNEIYFLMSAV